MTALKYKGEWKKWELCPPEEEGMGLVSIWPVSGLSLEGLVETGATMDLGQPRSLQKTSYA